MRRTSPALEAQVAAALAAGWPIVAIAEQTGISLSTVKRIRGRSGVRPDSMREELIEEARAGLRASLSSEFAASEGARLVRSQVALCNQIRSPAGAGCERLHRRGDIGYQGRARLLGRCAARVMQVDGGPAHVAK
ncbi:helix-turn-helix domain-containing protein [Aeromonas caviae]|uniref:helix-turn-helix domain-containing protein n=1 Tax=Aeromonas caviae TaxID=648 RepID=UPI00114D0120